MSADPNATAVDACTAALEGDSEDGGFSTDSSWIVLSASRRREFVVKAERQT